MKVKCVDCEDILSHRSMDSHMSVKHQKGKVHKCDICNIFFPRRERLRDHIILNHNEKNDSESFVCTQCGKTFLTKERFTNHIRMLHNISSNFYFCSICKKQFNNASKLREHNRKNHLKINCGQYSQLMQQWKNIHKTQSVDVMASWEDMFSAEEVEDIQQHPLQKFYIPVIIAN